MPRLPTLSGRDVVKVFQRLGWQVVRQSSSHIIMVREGSPATLSIPDHREVAKGTLRSPSEPLICRWRNLSWLPRKYRP
jgi:predicted RNA binding protein YcfA (HicA-like mRNA interferase family)